MSAVRSTARTPIERWPGVRAKGRPGYSARGLQAFVDNDDPLRVAERIAANEEADRLSAEVERRLAASETVPPMFDEISHARQACWAKLCASFAEVVAVLEREHARKPTPAIKRLLSAARRAQREAGFP